MCDCKQTQNSCNDYSLRTANTGIATVSTANNNLDGSGALRTVFTAGALGAIVKSVIIKATGPVTTGMVRLFLQTTSPAATILYKEVPVVTTPTLTNTPTPTPVLPMFEIALVGDLKLEAGVSIAASTQLANSFNIIVEGMDWDYPATLPTDCCNFKQVTAVTGLGLPVANTNLNGQGNIAAIFTAPTSDSNGSVIKNITIKALQSTSINGMIRLFISNDGGTSYRLMREIPVPQTTQSAYEPSYKQVTDLNFHLQPGYKLGATTQNAEGFAITIEGESWSYPIS